MTIRPARKETKIGKKKNTKRTRQQGDHEASYEDKVLGVGIQLQPLAMNSFNIAPTTKDLIKEGMGYIDIAISHSPHSSNKLR